MIINEPNFAISTNSKKDSFDMLLKLLGFTRKSFCLKMGIDIEILDNEPQWAINYLKDILNRDLTLLGYIMKDTKMQMLLNSYKNQVDLVNEYIGNSILETVPFQIKSTIVTEDVEVKINILVRAEEILKETIIKVTS